MKKYTAQDILELNSCDSFIEKVGENWTGTLVDILKLEDVSHEDRLWIVTRYLSDKQNRLLVVWCARRALKLVFEPDPRSIKACDIAEKFAYGRATEEELAAAREAAWTAVREAKRIAVKDAARAAAGVVAKDSTEAIWTAVGDIQFQRLIKAIEKREWDE